MLLLCRGTHRVSIVALLLVLLLYKLCVRGLEWTNSTDSRSWRLVLTRSLLPLLVDLRVFARVVIIIWSWWLLKSAIVIPFLIRHVIEVVHDYWRLRADEGAWVRISGHLSRCVMLLWDVDLWVAITLGNQVRRLLVYQRETVWVAVACRFWWQFGHLEITIHKWLLKLALYF